MQRAQFNQRRQYNDTFHKASVVNAPCHIGTEQFPDAGIIFDYANDKYSQACDEIVSSFRHLAKNDILQPHFTQKDIITSNTYPNGYSGYNFLIFDIRHHQDYSSAQPIKVRLDFRPAVPAATNLIGYALLLTNKLVSMSSDGQKEFDFI